MKILRLFAALLLIPAGLGTTAVAAAENLTTPEQLLPQLDAILKQAIAQSPRMIGRAVDLEMAENDRIAARANLLPSVAGSYSYTEAEEDRADLNGSSRVTKIAYNFSVSQPLYYWGERRNSDKMGAIRLSMAQGQYREGYRLFAQEVRNQYMRLILGKLRTTRTAYYRDFTANQAKLGEERLAKKVISDAQIFAIRMDAEKAQIGAERASFDYENDKASFARLTGTPQLKDGEIPDSIPPVTPQTESVQSVLAGFLAQKNPPALEAVNYLHLLEIERLGLANQKTRLKPKLNFVLGASQDQQSYTVNIAQKYQVKSLFAGVSGSWTIFDGFSTGAAVRSAQAKVRQMEKDYRGLTERLAEQAQSQARLIGFSARYISINERYLSSSGGSMTTRKEEFARGVISEEAVSTAQLGLYDAEITAYTSRADYYAQVGEFLGTVMEDPVLHNLASK